MRVLNGVASSGGVYLNRPFDLIKPSQPPTLIERCARGHPFANRGFGGQLPHDEGT